MSVIAASIKNQQSPCGSFQRFYQTSNLYHFTMMRIQQLAPFLCMFLMAAKPAFAGNHTLNAEEMKLFRLVADDKKQLRPEAKLDPILCVVARKRAADMVARNYFGHVNPDGKGPNIIAWKAGYTLPSFYPSAKDANTIESIASGAKGASQTVILWRKSPAHRAHVFGVLPFYREQTRIGVGVARAPKTGAKTYVFISAPENLNPKPPYWVLRNPSGKAIATSGSAKKAAAMR